jgi:hypothetical protein
MSELSEDIEAPRCRDCEDYHYGPCRTGAVMPTKIGDELRELAEIAPMPASTRARLTALALRVDALERERATLANVGGSALRQLHDRVSGDPRETVSLTPQQIQQGYRSGGIVDPYRPAHTADVSPAMCRYCQAAPAHTTHACHFDDGLT